MAKITRLSGHRDRIDLDFAERKRTHTQAIALSIQSHVAGLSLSNTVELLDAPGVQRSRETIHGRVQKTGLQPEPGHSPNQVALDETVIRLNDQQLRLYAAADPKATVRFTFGSFPRLQHHSPRFSSTNREKSTMSKPPSSR